MINTRSCPSYYLARRVALPSPQVKQITTDFAGALPALGEVLGLTWDGVDLDGGELAIGRQLQRVSRQLLHRETKTATSDATLPLPDICLAALKLRQAEEADARKKSGSAWQGGKLIFTTKWGTPIEPRNFNRSWDARCSKAGVRKITVHDGRRTCATLLVDLDVHPARSCRSFATRRSR